MPKTKKTPGRKKKATAKDVKLVKALTPPKIKKEDEGIEGEILEPTEEKPDFMGRPTVVTSEVKDKILEAFAVGCSNLEAAIHAKIAEKTLQNYFNKDEKFKEYCEEIKKTPTLQARMCLVKKAKTSAYFALKYLERKEAKEFSPRVIQTFEEPEPLTDEEQSIIDDAIDDNF